ncbi:ornithine carbamoyltransferase [Hyphomonas polymorpha PS728]|uniref:Ornithine carbamoyltransferase n=1 Tax=Hyphomonas polymorpha PS728 TaxID=1280954 RepID=A0A062VNE8_9PROT|nr:MULTISPECIES: ornithine carbamoyltransferase [Hyphomonas]AXE63096.1 ornithine carbamoyltransferase [Hyphomonas sp. CACIAM 19H1]KDA00265.1 ornithine carbamoyltransferase [Hyphomonas polymorpha PS728]
MTIRHFLDIWPIERAELRAILDEAHRMKKARIGWPKGKVDDGAPLDGHTLAMIFEKSSTRTRFSFDMAMRQLGGSSITATSSDMQLGRGETIDDTAKVLSRYVDAVMIRANDHTDVEVFAEAATVPVINGLTDRSHPCQIMADLLTLEEHGLTLQGARIAWVGDGNNVCASFIHAAPKFGFSLAIGTPKRFAPDEDDLEIAAELQGRIELFETAEEAVAGADVVIADTFVSMGDTDAERRLQILEPYAVTEELMALAAGGAKFLHCLPAHRGEEVDAEVIDGPASLVFDEAENRLHAQKAILRWCLGK